MDVVSVDEDSQLRERNVMKINGEIIRSKAVSVEHADA